MYFGWWLVAAGVVLMAVTSGTSFWAFGLYIQPVEDEFGWSRATVSFGISLSLLVSGLAAPFIGRLIDRYGPRRITLLGAVLTSSTFMLIATTSSVWEWYFFLSLNAVVRTMAFYIPFQSLVARWFDRRRGFAVGAMGVGFSLGGLVMVPVLRVVMDAWDWDGTLIFSGVLLAGVYLPLGFKFIRNHPSDVGQEVDGVAIPRGQAAASRPRRLPGLTPREALRTPLLWALSGALGFLFYGITGWMIHMLPYYESVGVSAGAAAGIVSFAAGVGIISRLGFGLLADKVYNIETPAAVLSGLLVVALATLLISGGSTLGIVIFLGFFLVGSAAGPMLEPLLLTRAFGLAHFATILGMVGVMGTIGTVVSPTVAGAIFDKTGAYDWALVMWISSVALGGLLFLVASRMPRPVVPEVVPKRESTAEAIPARAPLPGAPVLDGAAAERASPQPTPGGG